MRMSGDCGSRLSEDTGAEEADAETGEDGTAVQELDAEVGNTAVQEPDISIPNPVTRAWCDGFMMFQEQRQ